MRIRVLPALLALLALQARCTCGDDGTVPGPRPSATTPAPTAPAPDGLLADVFVAQPQHTWLALRTRLGGPTLLFPRSLGGLLITLLGLPLQAVQELDEDAPIVGAAVMVPQTTTAAGPAAPPPRVGVAFAVRVKHARRLLAQLTRGPDAKHATEPKAQGDMVWLQPGPSAQPDPLAAGAKLAMLDDYLLVGSDRQALEQLGPYLARNLVRRSPEQWRRAALATSASAAARPPASSDVEPEAGPAPASSLDGGRAAPLPSASAPPAVGPPPTADVVVQLGRQALSGPVRQWLTTAGEQLRASGWAELDALVDVDAMVELAQHTVGGLDGLDAAVRVRAAAVTVTARLRPADAKASRRLEALATTDPAAMLELPDDTVVAASWMDSSDARRRGAESSARGIADRLGEAMDPQGRQALRQALLALAEGRGDHTVAGLRCTGVGITGFAHGTVNDATQLSKAIELLAVLRRHGAVVGALRALGLQLSSQKVRVPNVPHEIRRFRLAPQPDPAAGAAAAQPAPDAGPEQEPIDLLFAAGERRFLVTAGLETRDTLQRLHEPLEERTLADHPVFARALRTLGRRAWFALVAEPLGVVACRQGKPGATPTALLSVAAGPAPRGPLTDGWLRVEVAPELLRAALQHFGR